MCHVCVFLLKAWASPMEGQTLSPFHRGPGLSFHVLETLSISVFLCVHVGG